MRINDIVNEAISTTQYEATVDSAVRLGIAQAMTQLAGLKGTYADEEEVMQDGDADSLLKKFHEVFPSMLAEKIAKIVKVKLSRAIGKDVPLTVGFDKLGSTDAIATSSDITVSTKFVAKLSAEILEGVYDALTDTYKREQWVDGTYFVLKMVGAQDKQLTTIVFGAADNAIHGLVSVFLHELVHVLQDQTQLKKGKTDTEYRSYLDKTKGELAAIDPLNIPPEKKERYYDLYYASPQEISAFANEMAMAAIRKLNLKNAKSEKDIVPITAEQIAGFVRQWIKDRYSDPKTPKEYQVFKRYAKLVYQEVQQYVNNVRKTFK